MPVLVTGSSGHLGEALVRTLRAQGREVVGLDLLAGPYTSVVGSITDGTLVREVLAETESVIHTATLHKPHVGTHHRQDFVDTNVTGTLCLLELAVSAGVSAFVFTSTTSLYGRALRPPPGGAAVWVTEDLVPVPKNIYGVTKRAAEDLAELVHREEGLACVVLRTSRFFPEPDDQPEVRNAYQDANIKLNELLYRRVDLADVVEAHLLALDRAPQLGFGRYILSATTPFSPGDLDELPVDATAVVRRLYPDCEELLARRGWRLFPRIERVYVNDRARQDLGWRPRYDFAYALDQIRTGGEVPSPLAVAVGAKGYHVDATFPYTQR